MPMQQYVALFFLLLTSSSIVLLMMELTPHEIARNVHAHPTLSEAIMEAARAATGNPIHT